MDTNSTPSDFTRRAKPLTGDALVEFLTEFSMKATPEQIDKMMLAAYGPDRQPGTASRAWSQEGKGPDPSEVRAEMQEALRRAASEPPPPPVCGPCEAKRRDLLTKAQWRMLRCPHSGEVT